jgi:hypothetical protein
VPKIFSSNSKKFLLQRDKPEKELSKFICENWKYLFPKNYVYIDNEFNNNCRKIDILGFNNKTKKFIIFELKKDYNITIIEQAATYRTDMQKNFGEVYISSTQTYKIKLPYYKDIHKDPEIILIAKKFSSDQIERAKEKNITLIKYFWFENDLILFDYLNNEPDDGKTETADIKNKEINNIKNIDSFEKEAQDKIDKFFGKKNQSKAAFIIFLKFLELNGQVKLKFTSFNKVFKIKFNNTTFSVARRSGKGTHKAVLLIMTDIDVTALNKQIEVDDRYRGEGIKMKGSWGIERFNVYFHNEDEVKEFCKYIKDKDFQPLQK